MRRHAFLFSLPEAIIIWDTEIYRSWQNVAWSADIHNCHTDNQRQHKTVAAHCLAPFTHPVCVWWAQTPAQRLRGYKTDGRHCTSHTGSHLVNVSRIQHQIFFILQATCLGSGFEPSSRLIQKDIENFKTAILDGDLVIWFTNRDNSYTDHFIYPFLPF